MSKEGQETEKIERESSTHEVAKEDNREDWGDKTFAEIVNVRDKGPHTEDTSPQRLNKEKYI